MAVLQIPVPNGVPFSRQRLLLDTVEFEIELRWNERESRFYIVLYDATAAMVISKKLVTDWPILRHNIDSRRPLGELIALDTLGTGDPVGLNDLGARVQLQYIEAADVAEALA